MTTKKKLVIIMAGGLACWLIGLVGAAFFVAGLRHHRAEVMSFGAAIIAGACSLLCACFAEVTKL